MTNQTPSPSPNHEHHDEAIAAIFALVALGTVFFVAVTRNGGVNADAPIDLPELMATGPDTTEIQGDSDENRQGDAGWRLPLLDQGISILGGSDAETDETGDTSESGAQADEQLTIVPFPLSDSTANGVDNSAGSVADNRAALLNSALGSANTEPDDGTELEDNTEADPDSSLVPDLNSEQSTILPDISPEAGIEEGIAVSSEAASTAEATSESGSPSPDDLNIDASTIDNSAIDNSAIETAVPELAEEVPTEAFADVAPQYWATPFIEGLRQQDIATGFVGGDFEPDSVISRAQFASQLDRAFTHDERSPLPDYDDVSADHPQYDAIMRITQSGFMQGNDVGDFLPDDQVSRMEVLLALVSGLELTVSTDPETTLKATYQDADAVPAWAVTPMATATELGLVVVQNDPAIFNPRKPATRAEAAAMLYQALAYLGEVPSIESEYIVRPQ
ncbi:MAG: S-layer homology domain-containing protein [Cyanothece sp. SIO2G6]|nr:S-layer homology domain-containing protein [Cyanothece sp. SIO2G6]